MANGICAASIRFINASFIVWCSGSQKMSKALRITWATSVFSSCLVKGAFMRSSGSKKPAIRQAAAK
mgnify:CR=1 FL=1